MAFLYVWEFSETMVRDGTQIPKSPGILQQTPVPISNTSAVSAAFNKATAFICITPDQICSINIGNVAGGPVTAATTHFRLAQGQMYLFGVNPGDFIACIANL